MWPMFPLTIASDAAVLYLRVWTQARDSGASLQVLKTVIKAAEWHRVWTYEHAPPVGRKIDHVSHPRELSRRCSPAAAAKNPNAATHTPVQPQRASAGPAMVAPTALPTKKSPV